MYPGPLYPGPWYLDHSLCACNCHVFSLCCRSASLVTAGWRTRLQGATSVGLGLSVTAMDMPPAITMDAAWYVQIILFNFESSEMMLALENTC